MLYIQVMLNRESSIRIPTQVIISLKHIWLFLYTCLKFKFVKLAKFLFTFFQPYFENFENLIDSSFVTYN